MASYADSNLLIYDRDSTGHSFVFDCASATAAGQKVNIAAGDTTLTVGTMATTAEIALQQAMHVSMREPTGVADRTKSDISFTLTDPGDAGETRVFDIQEVSSTFDIYSGGVKYTKTQDFVSIGSTTGLYYVYYSTAGVLTCSAVNTAWDIKSANVPVATVYWNDTTKKATFTALGNAFIGQTVQDYTTAGTIVYFDSTADEV